MLQIDPFIAFEIFSKFFESDITSLLKSYEEESIQLIRNSYDDDKSKDVGLYFKKISQAFLEIGDNKIQAQMLALIFVVLKK